MTICMHPLRIWVTIDFVYNRTSEESITLDDRESLLENIPYLITVSLYEIDWFFWQILAFKKSDIV